MKINILLLCLLLIKNTIDQIVSMKIKQPKGFDEIFGQRWDERAEDNEVDQTEQNGANEKNNCLNVIMSGEKTAQKKSIEQFAQNFKFLQGINSTEEKVRLAQAKATKTKKLTDEEKKRIAIKFIKLKDHFENKKMPTKMLEKEIAKTLGVHERTIYDWKKKFGVNGKSKIKRYSKEQKFKIVQQFDEIKSRKKGKSIAKSANEMDHQISKELGVSRSMICQWKKDFCMTKSNHYADSEKIKKVKKYLEMVEQNPHLSKKAIAEQLNVPQRTLNRWISNLQ